MGDSWRRRRNRIIIKASEKMPMKLPSPSVSPKRPLKIQANQSLVARRPRGRPKGALGQVVKRATALSLSEASFVRAAILHSTSSIDLAQVAKRYLSHRLDSLQGSSPAKLAREFFAAFLSAAPAAIASLSRSDDGELKRTAAQLERAVKNLDGVDPVNVRPAPTEPARRPAAQPPTLDAWIKAYEAEHPYTDLGEFSEGDLLEMYREDVGIDVQVVPEEIPLPSPAPSSSDPVVIARDFMFLAGLVAEDPHPADPCGRWLAPSVVAALRAAPTPVLTLADLHAFIHKWGHRWWTRVPGLGVARAMAILRWAMSNPFPDGRSPPSPSRPFPTGSGAAAAAFKELGLGKKEGAYGLLLDSLTRSRLPKSEGIAPVEFLALRQELDAEAEVVGRWLRGLTPNTQRAYHLALERLFIWIHVLSLPSLSALTPEHLRDFQEFVRNPGPQWCTYVRPHRNDPTWRPFLAIEAGDVGKAEARVAQNLSALRSFYRWARRHGWTADPFEKSPRRSLAERKTTEAGEPSR